MAWANQKRVCATYTGHSMTEQELIAEAKARANIATQKMNEQFHNESVKSDIDEVQQIEERVESWHQTYK
jgi:phage shock protein A